MVYWFERGIDYWRRSQVHYVALRRGYRILDKKGHGEPIVNRIFAKRGDYTSYLAKPHIYETQEHSRPYGIHRLIFMAVLLNLILPLSGLLYDNHMW